MLDKHLNGSQIDSLHASEQKTIDAHKHIHTRMALTDSDN